MSMRQALPWQLILADLALILFLVSLAALAAISAREANAPTNGGIAIAPAQALYRPSENLPEIGQWLDDQAIDPRATLSVFVFYREDDQDETWAEARKLADAAKERGVPVRVVFTQAQRTDIYASLAFDAPR